MERGRGSQVSGVIYGDSPTIVNMYVIGETGNIIDCIDDIGETSLIV